MKLDFDDQYPTETLPFSSEAAEWLRHRLGVVDLQLEALTQQRNSILQLIAVAKGGTGTTGHVGIPEDPTLALPTPARPVVEVTLAHRPIPSAIDLAGLEVNLTGTRNTLERIIRIAKIAEPAGKALNATELSRFIIASGESTATLRNLRTNVSRTLHDYPSLFEQVSPGTFRYLGNGFHSSPDSASDFQTNESTDSVNTANLGDEVNNP